jgi:DNA modification methylase
MIPFLTDENYIVWDPFAGSGVTAQVAEQLCRRWIINERSLTYLQGAALRAVVTAVPSNKSRPNIVVNV